MILLGLLRVLCLPLCNVQAEELPNILIIVADDQNSGMVKKAMPFTYSNIFKKGTNFTNFYVSQPLCCPSRTGFMTGYYPCNNGVTHNTAVTLTKDLILFTKAKELGYKIGVFGKFLNYFPKSPQVWANEWAVLTQNNGVQTALNFKINHNGKEEWHFPNQMPVLTAYALNFFTQNEGAKLVYYASSLPHIPAYAPKKYYKRFKGAKVGTEFLIKEKLPKPLIKSEDNYTNYSRWRERQLGASAYLDAHIKKIYLALKKENRPLITIYFSDNGLLIREYDTFGKNVPLQIAIKTPAAIQGIEGLPIGNYKKLAQQVDFVPTLFGSLGITFNNLDGVDLTKEDREGACITGKKAFSDQHWWISYVTKDFKKATLFWEGSEWFTDLNKNPYDINPNSVIPSDIKEKLLHCID